MKKNFNGPLIYQPKRERITGLQTTWKVASALVDKGVLGRMPCDANAFGYVAGLSQPSSDVSLRTIDPECYSIVDEASGAVIEQIEESMAFYEIYDGACHPVLLFSKLN